MIYNFIPCLYDGLNMLPHNPDRSTQLRNNTLIRAMVLSIRTFISPLFVAHVRRGTCIYTLIFQSYHFVHIGLDCN